MTCRCRRVYRHKRTFRVVRSVASLAVSPGFRPGTVPKPHEFRTQPWHTLRRMADALGTLRRFLLLTGLYYAGAVLASLYLRTPDDITLFWPSAGVGFAL